MNEYTSAKIASIAGRILGIPIDRRKDAQRHCHMWDRTLKMFVPILIADIRALAASALTQAPTKKRKTIRSPAKRASKPKCKPDHPSFPKFKRKVHAPFLRSGRTRDHLSKPSKRKS